MADSNRSATICYRRGTGNSYRVAQLIGKIAEESGTQSRILSFVENKSKNLLSANSESFITLVFPMHGFTAPAAF